MGQRGSMCASAQDDEPQPRPCPLPPSSAPTPAVAGSRREERPQGEVQKAFASQVDWEAVLAHLCAHPTVEEHYGEVVRGLPSNDQKVLQVRTLVPLAKAAYASKPGSVEAKRSGVLSGYRAFAEKKGIKWKEHAASFETEGIASFWEALRSKVRRDVVMPAYYKACYDGPIHSYDKGNGEWTAAFDAPSAYLLVHLHHFPDLSPQDAFDALHEELDRLALEHLPGSSRFVRAIDIGCGVGTSTFSTRRSLERLGRCGRVTGVDLSDYFISVASFLQEARAGEFGDQVELGFIHGDALDLASCGIGAGTAELVTISEVTHEMPRTTSEALFVEAARVLAPGGVLAYMDLNPAQILTENSIGNLVDRIATSNEPYFDEYLELDVAGSMRAAGLEVLCETWPNKAKYPTMESCSLRIFVARKPAPLTIGTWTGRWGLQSRENWTPYLKFLGIAEAVHEAATNAPDFHEYSVGSDTFQMDHKTAGMHLRFTSFIDGELHRCPYPVPTSRLHDETSSQEGTACEWKHEWVENAVAFKTTITNLAGLGKTVTIERRLVTPDELKMTVHVIEPESGEVTVGPCFAAMQRLSTEPPACVASELKELFATGMSRPLEWRMGAIDRVAAMVLENVEAISAAQAKDHVSPSDFTGASMMLKGAVAFYKANLASWAAAKPQEETVPPFMRTEGTWEVLPEPKGVGLVIAPWNAPVLLCVLPLLGMLAAGNLCVLKPSEAAPATSRLIAKLVWRYFPDRAVVVAEGGREVVERIIATPVDHILFTGGGEIGRKILALAAPHLTPVSLELGGKNPCFVDASDEEQLRLYAGEIIGTKSYFGGQFCQAHDYCLVHDKVFDAFVKIMEERIVALGDRRRCRMINARHAERVRSLLRGQEGRARPPLPSASELSADEVPVTLLLSLDREAAAMKEEVFGPLLPVVRVGGAQEAAEFVARRPKPLVAYCYSDDEAAWALFRDGTSSGNLAVNAGPQRMQSNLNVGFGGVGDSGFGCSIWGRAAFDDFSHHKAVFCGKQFAGSAWGAAPLPAKTGA